VRETLSPRALHLGLVLLAVVLLSPTPIPAPLVTAVRAAERAMAAGRSQAALPALAAAMAYEPSLAALSSSAATVALRAGQPDQALAFLERADGVSGRSSGRVCQRIEALLQIGSTSQAMALWEYASAGCKMEGGLLWQVLEAQIAAGDAASARATAQALAQVLPFDPAVALQRGLLTAVHSPPDALEPLRRARSGLPERRALVNDLIATIEVSERRGPPAYRLAQVGQTLARHERWWLAAEAFRQALALQPDYVEAQAYLGLALDRSGGDGLALLEGAVAAAPEAALPHTFLGMHWQARGDWARAQRELELAARLDPANPAVAAQLGALYAEQGDIASARAAYRLAAELAPRDPQFWLLLADFSLRREVEIEALGLPAARNALLLTPRDPRASNALGYAYFLLGDPTLAERFLSQAVGLEPGWAQARYHLGLLRLRQGDSDGARRELELALALDTTGRIRPLAERALEGLRR
jgi:tetratricopeptide (TPR) repeat protein